MQAPKTPLAPGTEPHGMPSGPSDGPRTKAKPPKAGRVQTQQLAAEYLSVAPEAPAVDSPAVRCPVCIMCKSHQSPKTTSCAQCGDRRWDSHSVQTVLTYDATFEKTGVQGPPWGPSG